MPCVWKQVPTLQQGVEREGGHVKTSKLPGTCFLEQADILFQRHFKVHNLEPISKTFLIYYFLTDYHSIFQKMKQENL